MRHAATVLARISKIVFMAAFVIFMIAPTIFIFPLAFDDADVLGFPPDGFSTRHLADVLTSTTWRHAFLSSFQVGVLAAAIATVLGVACALARPLAKDALARPFEILIMSPFVVPPVVLAVGWFGIFADLNMLGSLTSVAIGHALLGLPVVYLNVSAGLTLLDPRLVLASRSLGASRAFTLMRIELPLLAASVVSGALLTFVLSLDELVVALFLGGGLVDTVPIAMWTQINYVATPELAAAAALSVVISITTLAAAVTVFVVAQRRLASRHLAQANPSSSLSHKVDN